MDRTHLAKVPLLFPNQRTDRARLRVPTEHPVRLSGDARIVITAPFFPEGDPLSPRDRHIATVTDDLDGEGALVRRDLPWHLVMKGTLTYQYPIVDTLTSFVGGATWLTDLRAFLEDLTTDPAGRTTFDQIELSGVLFPDGYGSIAVGLRMTGGWEPDQRETTLATIGVTGRERLAERLRSQLLPPLQRLLRKSSTDEDEVVVLPYFNLTYAGGTKHPRPGRSTLDDDLRHLLYPDTPEPLESRSPWINEYLYTGYAYHLLATEDPLPSLTRLGLLLLILNASYARLARYAAAADRALQNNDDGLDMATLARIERRLQAEYESLITPTFSFDHHALKVRDAILRSWDVPKLEARTVSLISMVRGAVEFRLAQDQARRVRRLNYLVAALTAIAVVPVIETLIAIFMFVTR